jgi:hypothetical protein
LSLELYRLWVACAGTSRISKPSEYYDLPAIYVDACAIIEDERAKLEQGKRVSDGSE